MPSAALMPLIIRWFSVALLLVLAGSLPRLVRPGTATVTLIFPNSSYPALGELVRMVITYNDTADLHYQDSTYPLGHVITNITGTRVVWQATAAAPTSYTVNSTANILGVVPSMSPQYYAYNATLNTVLPYTGSLPNDGNVEYGSIVTYAFYNGTNYTSTSPFGQLYPVYFIVYNNFYYPTGVPDLMDYGGWMIWLDRYQPGNLNISMNPGYSPYKYAVNFFASGFSVSGSNDITDVQPYPPNYGSLYPNGIGGGFDGSIVAAAAGAVRGDPQFTGLRGQSYQVHGIDGGVYSLISDKMIQLNARFTFIGEEDKQECLLDPATQQPLYVCWSHAGSYVSALSLQTNLHSRLLLEAGAARQGFASVLVDGSPIQVGANTTLRIDRGSSDFSTAIISLVNERTVIISHAGVFAIKVQNSAGFLNILELTVDSWHRLSSEVQSHGLLGQTWRLYSKGEDVRDVEGRIDDYQLANGDMFGCDAMYTKFEC